MKKKYEIDEQTQTKENEPEITEAEMLKRKESEEKTRKRTRGPYRKSQPVNE